MIYMEFGIFRTFMLTFSLILVPLCYPLVVAQKNLDFGNVSGIFPAETPVSLTALLWKEPLGGRALCTELALPLPLPAPPESSWAHLLKKKPLQLACLRPPEPPTKPLQALSPSFPCVMNFLIRMYFLKQYHFYYPVVF